MRCRLFLCVLALAFSSLCKTAQAGDGRSDAPLDIVYGAPTYHAVIKSVTPLEKGKLAQLSLVLTDEQDRPVSTGRLEAIDGDKIHLLAIDESLLDFQHLYPQPAGAVGHYMFSFVPASAHNYKIFVDIKPKGKPAEDIPVLLAGKDPCKGYCVNIMSADRAKIGDENIYVTTDRSTVHVGEDVIGKLNILGKNGVPANALEPVLGSFAYIVGFYDDFNTVSHIRPVGFRPDKPTDRGSSPLLFVFHPLRAGYFKYFIQYRLNGQDVIIPMGIRVVLPGQSMPDMTKVPGAAPVE